MLTQDAVIFIAGVESPVGQALLNHLQENDYNHLVGVGVDAPDYREQKSVRDFFEAYRPEYVFVVGGDSGGIRKNDEQPATLMIDNMLLVTNVIQMAHEYSVKKLIFLSSSCTYPKLSPQPMKPEYLGSGLLEPTNIAYATAKIAGMQLTQAYRREYGDNFVVAIPANDFGPSDSFDMENAHVIGALMHRMHLAKQNNDAKVEIWGTGTPRRQFIYSEDVADALVFLMEHYDDYAPINIGGAVDVSIAELAEMIKETVGYRGDLVYDTSRPDGMPYKALDTTALQEMGWEPANEFTEALKMTYRTFVQSLTQHQERN